MFQVRILSSRCFVGIGEISGVDSLVLAWLKAITIKKRINNNLVIIMLICICLNFSKLSFNNPDKLISEIKNLTVDGFQNHLIAGQQPFSSPINNCKGLEYDVIDWKQFSYISIAFENCGLASSSMISNLSNTIKNP